MNNLPLATFLATELVERQLGNRPHAASSPSDLSRARTAGRTRIALADALDRAARAVAPAGYRPVH